MPPTFDRVEESNLQPAQRAVLPSPEEVRTYREKGWYVTRPLFSDAEIERAIQGVERHYLGERDAVLPEGVRHHLQDLNTTSVGDALRVDTYIAFLNRDVASLLDNPLLGAVAARLAGCDEVRLFTSALIHKPGHEDGRSRIGWHTDKAYFKTSTSERMLTAWVPLQDSTPEMGTPSFLEGSHRWQGDAGFQKLQEQLSFISEDVEGLAEQLSASGVAHRLVQTQVPRGRVCYLHAKIFHFTAANTSPRTRRAIAFFLQDGENRYRKVDADDREAMHTHDLICRRQPNGDPDYADPVICPRLWPPLGGRT